MAWNRPNQEEVEKRGGGGQRNVHLRGLIAGAIVVIVGASALLYFLLTGGESPNADRQSQGNRRIKEVKPAVVAKAVTNDTHQAQTNSRPGYVLSSTGVWQPAGVPYNPKWKKTHRVHTNRAFRVHKEVPYKNATEQLLFQTFTCKPGMRPMPLLKLPKKEMDNLIGILSSPTPILDTDSPELARSKDVINRAKKEFMKYIKDGGKPDDFFRHYHDQLERSFEMRMEAQRMSQNLESEGDDELTTAFQEKVNEKFRKEGITTIPVSGGSKEKQLKE